MNQDWCSPIANGIRITVQVTPNAKKTEVIGVAGDALKIRLHAQPIEGKANEALIRYLAETLGVARSAISIARGLTSKRKIVEVAVSQLGVDDVRKALVPTSD